jgi:hypothetical protein
MQSRTILEAPNIWRKADEELLEELPYRDVSASTFNAQQSDRFILDVDLNIACHAMPC